MEETKKTSGISLSDLWVVFRRCWLFMLIAALLLGGGTLVYLYQTHHDLYTAEASLWVVRETKQEYTQTSDVSIANNLIYDVAETVVATDVLNAVREMTGTKRSNRALAAMVKIPEIPNNTTDNPSHIVRIRVTGPDPEEASLLAQAFALCTCDKMEELFNGEKYVKPYDSISAPTSPSNPVRLTYIPVAAVAGAAFCYLIFLLLHILDGRVLDESVLERELNTSLLGEIPNAEDAQKHYKKKGRYYYYTADAAKKEGETK